MVASFLTSSYWFFYLCSSAYNIVFILYCFQGFCLYHWVAAIWLWCALEWLLYYFCFLEFIELLGLGVYIFDQIWKFFHHIYFFHIFFSVNYFFPSGTPITCILHYLKMSHSLLGLFFLLVFFLSMLIFKFMSHFFCSILFAVLSDSVHLKHFKYILSLDVPLVLFFITQWIYYIYTCNDHHNPVL